MVARLECSLQLDAGETTSTGMRQEVNIRYVVTSLDGSAQHLYEDVYCQRGQMENLIKLHKAQLASDCMSSVFSEHYKLMTDLMVLAWQTDMTRVCTLQVGNETSTSALLKARLEEKRSDWLVCGRRRYFRGRTNQAGGPGRGAAVQDAWFSRPPDHLNILLLSAGARRGIYGAVNAA
jgi:hypothetical protein